MASRLRAEAAIFVPAGGWDLSCTDSLGGPTTATLPEGTYFWSSTGPNGEAALLSALTTAVNAVMGRSWSFSSTFTANGTGQTLIEVTGGAWSVSWTDTALRDVLGWAGNVSSTGSIKISDYQVLGLWRSWSFWQSIYGGDGFQGLPESDKQDAENSLGYLWSVKSSTKWVTRYRFPQELPRSVFRVAESYTNESLQSFVEYCIHGDKEGFRPGGPVRIYPDVDDDVTCETYNVPGFQDWAPQRVDEAQQWDGLWVVEFPRLVLHPDY